MTKQEISAVSSKKKQKGGKAEKREPTFTREQLICSKKFRCRQDALAVVLEENEKVSVSEAAERLKQFMKRKVE